MLQTTSLTFAYPSGPQFEFPPLHVEVGHPLLILGNSGTGKTTLLHLLGLLLRPSTGQIRLANTTVSSLPASEQNRVRGSQLGIVFQKPHLIPSLNVADNLLLANYLAGQPYQKQHLNELANALQIEPLLSKKIQQLSGGEQQRVSIARALMNRPRLVLADEPTSNLDDDNAHRVADLLLEQTQAAGAALVIVTHDHRLKNRLPNQLLLTPQTTEI